MFDDDEDCDHDEDGMVVRPWSWMHAAAVTANLAANLSKAAWAFFDDLKEAAQAHVAVGDESREAWASLHRDLETL